MVEDIRNTAPEWPTITLLIADEQAMFRQCLVSRLGAEPDLKVLADVAEAAALVPLVREQSPRIVLLDGQMSGRPFQVGQEIASRFPATSVVYLGDSCSDSQIAQALAAGACGYLLKSCSVESFIGAIRAVAAGRRQFDPQIQSRLTAEDQDAARPAAEVKTLLSLLTRRELEVLRLMGSGLSRAQMAVQQGVSYKTIDNQACSVMRKLDLHSRAEVVLYAIQEQLVAV